MIEFVLMALAEQICTVKTSLMSQTIPKKFLHNTTFSAILHSLFNYHTLPVTPFIQHDYTQT